MSNSINRIKLGPSPISSHFNAFSTASRRALVPTSLNTSKNNSSEFLATDSKSVVFDYENQSLTTVFPLAKPKIGKNDQF